RRPSPGRGGRLGRPPRPARPAAAAAGHPGPPQRLPPRRGLGRRPPRPAFGLAVDREVALAVVAIHGLPGCAEARQQAMTEATTAAHRIFTAGESVVA